MSTTVPTTVTADHRSAHPPLRLVTRTGTIAALAVGSLLNLVAALLVNRLWSGTTDDPGTVFVGAGGMVTAIALANIIAIPAIWLGIVGLATLSSRRAPVSSRLAVVLTSIGMTAFLAQVGAVASLNEVAVSVAPDVPDAVLAGIAGEAAGPVFLALVVAMVAGNTLGILAAVFAFARSRVVPLWATAALLLFGVSDFLLPSLPYVDWHVLFVAFAAGAAVAVARTRPEHWRPGAEDGTVR